MIDQFTDPGNAYLCQMLVEYPNLGPLVKQASLVDDLTTTQFAWPELRRYPIHNREHTALSLGYSKLASNLPPHVTEALNKASVLYDIPATLFTNNTKTAAESDYYLLPEIKRFKVGSALDVPLVEDALMHKLGQLTPEQQLEASYRLVKVAEQYGVTLQSDELQRRAGCTITNTVQVADWLGGRKVAAARLGTPIVAAYDKLEQGVRNLPTQLVAREQQLKLAAAIYALDKEAGLTYSKKLPDPISTVFNTKTSTRNLVKLSGAYYDKALLAKIPSSFWSDVLGDDILKEVAPAGVVDVDLLSTILPTLPVDIQKILNTQLAAYV